MSVTFTGTGCSEPVRKDILFGLCDNQDGAKAYSDVTDKSKWIAVVVNDDKVPVIFTAIDNCIVILNDDGKTSASRCDGMLTYSNTIYLVELKDQMSGWIARALGQLKATMEVFNESPESKPYKYKKAFACNKRHPYFQRIDNELNLKFYRKYGFRIDIQAKIVIK